MAVTKSADNSGSGQKLPYSPPKLTVYGDLQTLTAAKGHNRTDSGTPKTWSTGSP